LRAIDYPGDVVKCATLNAKRSVVSSAAPAQQLSISGISLSFSSSYIYSLGNQIADTQFLYYLTVSSNFHWMKVKKRNVSSEEIGKIFYDRTVS
jgi:hypothetical protein